MSEPEKKEVQTLAFIAVCVVAILLSFATAGFALVSRFDATSKARQNNKETWHGVICSIEKFTVQRKDLSLERKQSALKFYDDLLVNNVKTTPCGLLNELRR